MRLIRALRGGGARWDEACCKLDLVGQEPAAPCPGTRHRPPGPRPPQPMHQTRTRLCAGGTAAGDSAKSASRLGLELTTWLRGWTEASRLLPSEATRGLPAPLAEPVSWEPSLAAVSARVLRTGDARGEGNAHISPIRQSSAMQPLAAPARRAPAAVPIGQLLLKGWVDGAEFPAQGLHQGCHDLAVQPFPGALGTWGR